MKQQSITTWKQWLSAQWHMDVDVTSEQETELTALCKSVGRGEFEQCTAIVASANEPSRSVRYLITTVNNRKVGSSPSSAPPSPVTTKKDHRTAYIYHRCNGCGFVNKVRRDVLESNRGKVMKCGGIVCNTSWMVDDVIKNYERETGNV